MTTAVINLDLPGAADQPVHLRALRRTPRTLHLRRHLGRRGLRNPQRPRHPLRRRRGAARAQHPHPALARRLFRRRVPLARRHRASRPAAQHGQHPLGQRHRGQLVRHPRVHGPVRATRHRALHLRQRGLGHGARDGRLDRVPHPRRHRPDVGTAPRQRTRRAVARPVLGHRQRIVGLWRPDAGRALRRPGPPVLDVLPRARRQRALQDRLRGQRRRLPLDRGAHEDPRRPRLRLQPAALLRRDLAAQLHLSRRVGAQALRHRVRRRRLLRHPPRGPAHRGTDLPARHDHGRLRSRQAGRPRARRVGHVVRPDAGHQPPIPRAAEHHARRARRRGALRRVPPPR